MTPEMQAKTGRRWRKPRGGGGGCGEGAEASPRRSDPEERTQISPRVEEFMSITDDR